MLANSLFTAYNCNMAFFLGGEDYKGGLIESENLNQILSFPTGSVKGSRRCFNITITNDLLVEEQEMFSVNVRVDDAEAAQFGGALNSSTGSVAVNIIDNDGTAEIYPIR